MKTIKITAWVARDYNGSIGMFTAKPTRHMAKYAGDEAREDYWVFPQYGEAIEMPSDWDAAFEEVTWDDDPVKVEITTVKE